MAGFTPEQEAIVRNALAESAAAVDARPDLDLIRTRINADKRKAPAAATAGAEHPRKD